MIPYEYVQYHVDIKLGKKIPYECICTVQDYPQAFQM